MSNQSMAAVVGKCVFASAEAKAKAKRHNGHSNVLATDMKINEVDCLKMLNSSVQSFCKLSRFKCKKELLHCNLGADLTFQRMFYQFANSFTLNPFWTYFLQFRFFHSFLQRTLSIHSHQCNRPPPAIFSAPLSNWFHSISLKSASWPQHSLQVHFLYFLHDVIQLFREFSNWSFL